MIPRNNKRGPTRAATQGVVNMKLKSRALGALAGMIAFAALAAPASAQDRAYTEGPVSVVSSIRTEPGMYDTYLRYLQTTYKPMMDEAKKAGIVLDYAIYDREARGPDEPNLYLVVTYKNMAAMDGLSDKMDPIQQKYFGDMAKRDAAMIERSKMRKQLGSEMIREVVLK
jgi:L-rhamnose mutarotase